MTEMIWTTMHIGGALPENRIEALTEAVHSDFSEHTADSPDHGHEDAIEEKRSVCFQGYVNYGDPDEVVAFCWQHDLPYWLHFEAKGGVTDGGIQVWAPGMEKALEETATSETYEPVATLDDMRRAKAAGLTLDQVIEKVERFDPNKVPPLTLGPSWIDDDGPEGDDIPLPETVVAARESAS